MKYKVILFCFLFTGLLLKAQWEPQISGTDDELNSVYFINEMKGWVCGKNGIVIYTDNGGVNWEVIPVWTDLNMVSVYFANEMKGWILARNESVNNSEVYNTNDGGVTWSTQITLDKYTYKLFFLNEFNGWLAGESAIWRTVDGGISWNIQLSGLPDGFYTSVYFLNPQIGWAVSANYTLDCVYKSVDGGISWEGINLPESGYKESVFFLDENTGWITCNILYTTPYGIIMKTTDGGISWNVIFEDLGYWFKEIYFANENTGWVVGGFSESYAAYRTDDGGSTWAGSNYGYYCTNEIHVINDNGWLVGCVGTILYNNNLILGENALFFERDLTSEIICYPNPFTSTINFELNTPADDSNVSLFIYNIEGMLVNKFFELKKFQKGKHIFKWNASNQDGLKVNSGIYMLKLKTDDQIQIKRLILMK